MGPEVKVNPELPDSPDPPDSPDKQVQLVLMVKLERMGHRAHGEVTDKPDLPDKLVTPGVPEKLVCGATLDQQVRVCCSRLHSNINIYYLKSSGALMCYL